MLNFLKRIICPNKNHNISKQTYTFILKDKNKQYKWLKCIKDILLKTVNGIIWATHNYNKVNNIHLLIKQNLTDLFKQKRSQETKQSQKGRTYNTLKN